MKVLNSELELPKICYAFLAMLFYTILHLSNYIQREGLYKINSRSFSKVGHFQMEIPFTVITWGPENE